MMKLDDIDVKLLQALQKDAKCNTKDLCDVVHISKTPIYERIKRMENDGIIKGYTALVDNKKVGLPLVVFCNVTLVAHDDEHIDCFKKEIMCLEEVMECYSTGGVYDFLLKIILKDFDEYNVFVFDKLTKVHGIAKMQSSFVLDEIKHTTTLNIRV